jgi:hypothetical protein
MSLGNDLRADELIQWVTHAWLAWRGSVPQPP